MTALETINAIASNEFLRRAEFLRYCFVTKDKVPLRNNGTDSARPNVASDFVPLGQLDLNAASTLAGIGISVQASGICAIDIDKCFTTPFDLSTADYRAQDIINIFGDSTYIEFSFSGTGMRILFKAAPIQNYEGIYYIKNSKTQCEYYFPQGSARYVTITSRPIIYAPINFISDTQLAVFLDTYMKRPVKSKLSMNREIVGDKEELLKHYLRSNKQFQDNWFDKAPGSNSNESERDFFLLSFILENIVADRDAAREMFERSDFFKSKDRKHVYKWEHADHRYFNYLYNVISGGD